MWKDRDRFFNPIKSTLCALGLSVLVVIGLIGLIGAARLAGDVLQKVFRWMF